MPIYEFKCPDGHYTEQILSKERFLRYKEKHDLYCWTPVDVDCTGVCGKTLEQIWSMPANIRTPEDSKSNFNYFENAKGEVTFNSLNDGWQPHGFERKTARNLFERLSVEKRLRNQSDAKLVESYERDDMRRHFSEAERHSNLNAAISQGAIAVENPETGDKETVYLDDKTKSILKKGMQHSINRKPRRKHSDFRLEANHSDSSTIKNKE